MKAGYASAFLDRDGLECFKRYLVQECIFLLILTCGRFTGQPFEWDEWDVCSLLFSFALQGKCAFLYPSFTYGFHEVHLHFKLLLFSWNVTFTKLPLFFAMLSLFLVVRFLIYKIAFLCLINFHSCGGLHSDDFRSITDVLLVLPSQVYESDQGLPCNSQGLTAGQWERTHQDSMFIFIITGILKFGQYFIFLWCWQHEF